MCSDRVVENEQFNKNVGASSHFTYQSKASRKQFPRDTSGEKRLILMSRKKLSLLNIF